MIDDDNDVTGVTVRVCIRFTAQSPSSEESPVNFSFSKESNPSVGVGDERLTEFVLEERVMGGEEEGTTRALGSFGGVALVLRRPVIDPKNAFMVTER